MVLFCFNHVIGLIKNVKHNVVKKVLQCTAVCKQNKMQIVDKLYMPNKILYWFTNCNAKLRF